VVTDMTPLSDDTPKLVSSRDGTPVAYWQGGGGDPLLLVHGATSDHSRWARFLPRLTSHRTVCVMDRRGRGSSGDAATYSIEREYEDVAAVIDGIASEAGRPVDVFSHSYGALCSLQAALLTTAIRKLVLYEAPAHFANTPEVVDLLDRIDELVADGRREQAVEAFFREAVRAPVQEIELLKAQDAWSARVANAHTIAREARAALAYRFHPSRFTEMTAPTLLIVGGDNPTGVDESATLIVSALPDAQVTVLEGEQHMAMDTAPQRLADIVLAFLDRTEG
jgi:pimeloyl-ACP methyl ester carboxylesterase